LLHRQAWPSYLIVRKTAAKYLTDLEKEGFLVSDKIERERIYLNIKLFELVKKTENVK